MTTRIGFVHFGRYPDIRVSKMLASLADAGHEVFLLTRVIVPASSGRAAHPYADAAERRMAGRPNVTLRALTSRADRGARRIAGVPYHVNPIWRRAIRDLVRRDRCQLLIVREIPLALAAIDAARASAIPVVLDMAENYPALLADWRASDRLGRAAVNSILRNVALARWLERRVVQRVDAVVVVVPEHLERVAKLRGRESGLHVVENTPVVDELDAATARLKPRPLDDRLEVVYAGGVHYYRGIDTLIDAASIVKRRGLRVRWTIVGDGPTAAELQHRSALLGLEDVVDFTGFRPNVVEYIVRADVGVVPPHRSPHYDVTMPNKLYDFMALRKPVVVSDTLPMARVVNSTSCGLVFESGKAPALADRVASLFDPNVRGAFGANGRSAVEQRYRWDVDAQTLLSVVADVVNNR